MVSIKYENTVHQAPNKKTSMNVFLDSNFWSPEIRVDVGTLE